jgi:hypothetical protein
MTSEVEDEEYVFDGRYLVRPARRAPLASWCRRSTRNQLYQEAKHKGIAGRSKMTKAQLERAVDR